MDKESNLDRLLMLLYLKAVIKNADMCEDMQQDAVDDAI
jgi:hypothetical protein